MTPENKNLATVDDSQSPQTNSSSHNSKSDNLWHTIRENGLTLIIAIVLAGLIRIFIAEPRYIPSDSMLPTLLQGDRLVVEKVSYYFKHPVRGDIVVFQPPTQLQMQGYDPNQAFIKRIIALGGETVAVQNGVVYINNEAIPEDYIAQLPQYNLPTIQVPEGTVFVMGDNRNNSNDSHIWGFLPEKNIIGRALFRFWPFTRIGEL